MSSGQALLIGATDAAVEGTWKWAVGPEAGTAFWLGAANGGAVGGNYARWNAGEPNDSGNEDVATIQSSTGGWNDIPVSFATGYVMEWSPPSAEQRGILENASKTFSADVLLGNDTDADGNTLSIVSIQTTSSRGASVSYDANTRQVTYNAASSSELAALVFGQTITDTFSYTVSDGKGGTDTATVTVTVVGKNDTPAIGTPGAGQVIEDFDLTAVQGERITNGNFQSGTSGWQIANVDPVWGGLVTAGGSTAYSIYTHNTTVPTTIAETLQTTVGVTYDVSFLMNHNSTTDPSSAVTVYWGGIAYLALANIPGVGNYDTFTQYSFKALASSTSTIFQISAVSVSSSLIFDNISVKASATETTTGVLTFGDAELNDVHTVAASARAAGYVGSFQATMTDDSTGDGVGHISWLFNVDNSQIHWLAAGATLQQVYAVSVTDGFGNVGQQDVTVTIIGTNDAPVLTADTVKIAGFVTDFPGSAAATPVVTETTASNNTFGTAQDIARSTFLVAPNGDLGDATLPSVVVKGALSTTIDIDVYKLTLKAGETVNFDIDRTTNGLDSFLILRNSAGASIQPTADDSSTSVGGGGSTASTDSDLSYTVTTSGTYYIDVRSYNFGFRRGSYQLNISIDHWQTVGTGTNRVSVDDLLANDSDADLDALTLVSVAGAGVALVDGGHSVELQAGVSAFTYTVSDGHVLTTTTVNVQQYPSGATINGTSGDELLVGTASVDTINGGDGRDRIVGGGGNDILNGEASDDIIRGGVGDDTIDGGTGMDIIDFSDATAGIDVTLVQSAGNTTVNLVAAGLGTDTYRNIEGVFGTAFADTLYGTALNDYFNGGGGNDILIGGGGSDTLIGGAGSDTLKWFNGDIASGAFDTLLDFETGAGGDIIDLSVALSGVSGNKADHVRTVYTADNFTQLASAAGAPHAADGDIKIQVNLSGSTWTDVAVIHDTGAN